MKAQANGAPEVTATKLVLAAIQHARPGDIVSMKATIAVVRVEGPQLLETDCELVEIAVQTATVMGLAVVFDQEP